MSDNFMFPNHGIFISSFHDAFFVQSAAESLKHKVFLMKIIFAGCFSLQCPFEKTLDLNFNVSHRSSKKYLTPMKSGFAEMTAQQ